MSPSPEARADVESVDCSGYQALVTGSTSGIGRAVALALGRLGADVVVHGRDEQAGTEVVRELDRLGVDGQFVSADFADVEAVESLARTVRETTDGLDLLINNAGGLFRNAGLTDAGIEYTFHVNHLSPYLLTATLLDHLNKGGRVVTTASSAHQGAKLELGRIQGADVVSGVGAYSHSKLANVLFASELADRFDAAGRDITSNSVHPGAIPGSGFSRFLPGPLSTLVQQLEFVPGVTSVADGAAEILHVALSPETADVSGRYFTNQHPRTPSMAARDEAAARRLWTASADLLDIEEPLPVAGRSDDGAETASMDH